MVAYQDSLIYLANVDKFSLKAIHITGGESDSTISIASKKSGKESKYFVTRSNDEPIEYVQDPDAGGLPAPLIKVDHEPGLLFTFTFVLKQNSINALTFFSGGSVTEIDRLMTCAYNADSNIQKHRNVKLIGDYNTDGELEIEYSWHWTPCDQSIVPAKHGGWKSVLTFSEFKKSENKFSILGVFNFWIHEVAHDEVASLPIPRPGRLHMPSFASTSITDALSRPESPEIMTPLISEHSFFDHVPATTTFDQVSTPALPSSSDVTDNAPEDGPVFRATLSELESKTAAFRMRVKKVMKRAAELKEIYRMWRHANARLTEAIQAIASEKASLKPVMDSYINVAFSKLAEFRDYDDQILGSEIIEPLRRIYDHDIKAAEGKKREFEDESRDYYAFLGRYLSKKNDASEKKLLEKDTKYTTKKRNFELKRFDYYCYVQDLHGGRKEQEVLRQLTRYAEKQSDSLLLTADAIKSLKPSLDALSLGVQNATNDYKLMRTEREERRRIIEKSVLPESLERSVSHSAQSSYDREPSSLGSAFSPKMSAIDYGSSPDKRLDLEQPRRKEGILWALSKPGSHTDPGVPVQKLNWHKFWVTLGSGQITEYRDWKEGVKHSGEPIDLRMATVRAARNTDRRFCFEIITPHLKRVYQTTSDEELDSWVKHIVSAIEGILDGSDSTSRQAHNVEIKQHGGNAQAFFGQGRTRVSIARELSASNGATPSAEDSRRILRMVKEADPQNAFCADCGGSNKVEWCSINLGIILCIECSGVHRSLGSHVSKVRSLTMDTNSFNPDLVDLLCRIGNGIGNPIYEATLSGYDVSMKPTDKSSNEVKTRFIRAKYIDRSFVEYPSISPNDVLLGSLTTNNVAAAYGAIAARANVNMVDRHQIPAIILSLLTTDPPSSPSKELKGEWRDESSNTFPLAELLLQNGAELSTKINDPSIQSRLSLNAKNYINTKTRKAPEPVLQRSVSNGNSFVTGAQKLQKRISSGSRILKSPPVSK